MTGDRELRERDLRELFVAVAGLSAQLADGRQDIKNLTVALGNVASKDDLKAVNGRVDKIDGHIAKVVWALLAGGAGIVASFFGVPQAR